MKDLPGPGARVAPASEVHSCGVYLLGAPSFCCPAPNPLLVGFMSRGAAWPFAPSAASDSDSGSGKAAGGCLGRPDMRALGARFCWGLFSGGLYLPGPEHKYNILQRKCSSQ